MVNLRSDDKYQDILCCNLRTIYLSYELREYSSFLDMAVTLAISNMGTC